MMSIDNKRLTLGLIAVNLLLVFAVILLATNSGHKEQLLTLGSDNAMAAALSDKEEAENPVIRAAEKVSPAVVSIGAVKRGYVVDSDPFNFFSPFIAYPYTQRLPYLGSGFIINADGYILTNFHVIEGAVEVSVTLVDGRQFKAKVVDADSIVDVALLKIEGKNLPYVEFGDSDDLRIGQWVIAVGNPFGGLIEDPRPTVTFGVVSALNRAFDTGFGDRVYHNMIQTDAAINPGNSGGPLVNINGEVIGMNTFIVTRSGGSLGMGFAIPIDRVSKIVEEIMKYGRVRPLLIDFDCLNVSPYLARLLQAPSTDGVIIRSIYRDGPAEQAGLKVEDIIVKADDKKIRNCDDLRRYLATRNVGDVVNFTVFRNGKYLTIIYKLKEYKPSD